MACGPDTLSHRHIMDVLPAIRISLQKAIDKPIDDFDDINVNFSRLLSKLKSGSKKDPTEKILRPIVEANVLTKYTTIKIFIAKIREKLIPFLGKNQYAFPGKGTPAAIADLMDTLNFHACAKVFVILALWDFSNAFCTFSSFF